MGINFKEVASLRGDDKKYEENFNQIDWSLAEKKEKFCPDSCGGCSCHISPPCSHCVDHGEDGES